jgi:hypothetical protein
VLRAARKLIEDPEHWTTAALARDANGKEVPPDAGEAVRWCAYGACVVVSRSGLLMDLSQRALEKAASASGGGGVEAVNDNDGHAAVLELYDTAIRRGTS